jgi:6-phosphogluconolactonase (cycloisomerase 2 family)
MHRLLSHRARPGLMLAAALSALTIPAIPCLAQADEPTIFIVNNVSDGVTTYTVDDDGVLTLVGTYATSDGPIAPALSPDGRFLAVTHGTQNEVTEALWIFRVNADSSLTLVHQDLVPNAPLDAVWLSDSVLAVSETSLIDTNMVHTYIFDPDVPSLTEIDAEATGIFNTSLERHPSLPILYTNDSGGYTVRWFEFDDAGNLTPISSVSTAGVYPIDLVMSPNGSFMYGGGGTSSGGDKILALLADDEGDLTLHPDGPFISSGGTPAYNAISEDNRILLVGHGSTAELHTFFIDFDGSLTATGYSFDVGLQGTLGDIKVLGEFAFVTDESTAIDGITGVYSFQINADGTLTQLGDIYDHGGVRPESIEVWDPGPGADLNGDGVVNVFDLLLLLEAWG